MQKLLDRNTCTPQDTPLVLGNCDSGLNRDQSLSVQSLKTSGNSLEVDQPQLVAEPKANLLVYVVNQGGRSLMPCKPVKAKHLLKRGRAKVVSRKPFTIQLLWKCEENVQSTILGVDSGYRRIGFSVVSDRRELISGTVELDNNMVKRLSDRRTYRRGRRSGLWYREPRFLNRVSSKKKGWLPPSIERRYQTHLRLIERLKKMLPITSIVIEVGKFDIQKIENEEISGKAYQQGDLYGYQNRIAYLVSREGGICQYCNKKYKKRDGWRLHHIWGRDKDRPQDWALVHKSCHDELHRKREEYTLREKESKSYKDSTFMNIVRKRFWNDVKGLVVTYGNYTYVNRNELSLEKSHVNDAFVIARGNRQVRVEPFEVKQKRRNNRRLERLIKGKRRIRKERYKLQPGDLVDWSSRLWKVVSVFSCGNSVELIDEVGVRKYPSPKKVGLVKHGKGLQFK